MAEAVEADVFSSVLPTFVEIEVFDSLPETPRSLAPELSFRVGEDESARVILPEWPQCLQERLGNRESAGLARFGVEKGDRFFLKVHGAPGQVCQLSQSGAGIQCGQRQQIPVFIKLSDVSQKRFGLFLFEESSPGVVDFSDFDCPSGTFGFDDSPLACVVPYKSEDGHGELGRSKRPTFVQDGELDPFDVVRGDGPHGLAIQLGRDPVLQVPFLASDRGGLFPSARFRKVARVEIVLRMKHPFVFRPQLSCATFPGLLAGWSGRARF